MTKIPMFRRTLDLKSPFEMFTYLAKASKEELGKLKKKGKLNIKSRMKEAVNEYQEETGSSIRDFPGMLKDIYSDLKQSMTPKSALGYAMSIGSFLLLYPEHLGTIVDLVRIGAAVPLFMGGMKVMQSEIDLEGLKESKEGMTPEEFKDFLSERYSDLKAKQILEKEVT